MISNLVLICYFIAFNILSLLITGDKCTQGVFLKMLKDRIVSRMKVLGKGQITQEVLLKNTEGVFLKKLKDQIVSQLKVLGREIWYEKIWEEQSRKRGISWRSEIQFLLPRFSVYFHCVFMWVFNRPSVAGAVLQTP